MVRKHKGKRGWAWAIGACFGLAYLVVAIVSRSRYAARSPVFGTALAVMVTIPLAGRAKTPLRGALGGLGLGLAGAVGIILALYDPQRPPPQHVFSIDAAITIFTTMFCCAVAGGVFALLRRRRRRILYGDDE